MTLRNKRRSFTIDDLASASEQPKSLSPKSFESNMKAAMNMNTNNHYYDEPAPIAPPTHTQPTKSTYAGLDFRHTNLYSTVRVPAAASTRATTSSMATHSNVSSKGNVI